MEKKECEYKKYASNDKYKKETTDSDYITLIMVYITCIIYGCINDLPILVIHTCIYYVHCHIPPISEIMDTTVDTCTYHMMEPYCMYSIFHVNCMTIARCFIIVNIMPYTYICNITYASSHKYAYMCMDMHEYA